MASGNNVPVSIEFHADPGNVDQVAKDIQKDLADLGKVKDLPTPKLKIDTEIDAGSLKAELLKLESSVPAFDLEAVLDAGPVKRQLEDLGSSFKLPPIEWTPPPGLALTEKELENLRFEAEALAGADLAKIRGELDAILNVPGLAGQAEGYAAIVQQLEQWEKQNQGVLQSSDLLRSQLATFTASAQQGLEEVVRRSRDLADVAQQVALGFGGVATLFGGIATASVAVASNFEQLQVRLESVTGSAAAAFQKFEQAKQVAAQSPFDLRSVVSATATLEGFKLKSEELLPVAANLAAAMGGNLEEATLRVGKAAIGSSEGFESLRDEYAVTTDQLVKFGAVLDKSTGGLSHATKDIEANRNALIRLVQANFPDAMVRQSQTLAGAVSNVGDSAQTAAAAFGQGLIPAAVMGAKAVSGLISLVGALPAPLLAFAAAGTVAVAGVAGLGAVAAGGVAALLLLQAQLAQTVLTLKELEIEAPLASAALQSVSAGAARVSGALTTTNLAIAGSRLAFLGLAGVVATVGLAIIDTWEKTERRVGDAIRDTSRNIADSNQFFRQGIEALNDAGREAGVTVKIVGQAGEQMDEIAKAFAQVPADQLARSFINAGLTVDKLRQELEKLAPQALEAKKNLELLMQAQQALQTVQNSDRVSPEFGQAQGSFLSAQRQLADRGIQIKNDLADVDRETKGWLSTLHRVNENKAIASKAIEAQELLKPLTDVSAASQQVSHFLDLSEKVGTVQAYTNALEVANKQIEENAKKAQVGTANQEELLRKLNDPKLQGDGGEAERKALEDQLSLIQKRDAFIKAQADAQAKADKAAADAAELAFARRKALGQTNLHDELYFVQQRLAAAKQGSEEEVRLLERQAHLKEAINKKLSGLAQDSFKQELDAAQQVIRNAEAGLSGKSVGSALDEAKRKVEAWAEAHKPLLAANKELQEQLEKFRSDNAIAQQREQAKELKDNLQALVAPLQTAISEATTGEQKLATIKSGILQIQNARRANLVEEAASQTQINQLTKQKLQLETQLTKEKQQQKLQQLNDEINIDVSDTVGSRQKLEAVERGITQLKEAQKAGTIAQEAAEHRINDLTRQKAQLEKQITDEGLKRQVEVSNQALTHLQEEQQLLEARKQAGQNVEQAITENHRKQVQQRLQIIEQEKQAQIKATGDVEAAEKDAQSKITTLQNQERLKRYQDAVKAQQQIDNIKSRVGGAASPVYSDPNEGLGIHFDAFNLGNIRPPAPPIPSARRGPATFRIQQEQALQQTTRAVNDKAAQQTASSSTTNNYSTNINGVTVKDSVLEALITRVVERTYANMKLKGKA